MEATDLLAFAVVVLVEDVVLAGDLVEGIGRDGGATRGIHHLDDGVVGIVVVGDGGIHDRPGNGQVDGSGYGLRDAAYLHAGGGGHADMARLLDDGRQLRVRVGLGVVEGEGGPVGRHQDRFIGCSRGRELGGLFGLIDILVVARGFHHPDVAVGIDHRPDAREIPGGAMGHVVPSGIVRILVGPGVVLLLPIDRVHGP